MPVFKSPYPPVPERPPINFYEFILGRPEVKEWPNYTLHVDALTGEKRRLREVIQRIEDGATALSASASEGGLALQGGKDFVGILSDNGMEYPVLVLSLLKIAVPMALLPSLLTPGETTELLKLSRLTCLFVSPEMYPLALAAAKESGLREDRIFILQGRVDRVPNFPDFIQNARDRTLSAVPTQPVRNDTMAYMVFSSGTSGLPKGVMVSHRNMYHSVMQSVVVSRAMAEVHKSPSFDTPEKIPVGLGFLPFYHAMGLHTHILRALLAPFTVIILPRWDADLVVELLTQRAITHMSMVPSMVLQIVTSPKFTRVDLSKCAWLNSGAAYLPPEIREKLHRRAPNTPFIGEGYGMSECTLAALAMPFPGTLGGRFERVPHMTGVLLPGVEARVVREDGNEVAFNEPGELQVYGPNVALGYWHNEKATKETFLPDGWLRTGDRFTVDEIGRFSYVDRMKDIMKISGAQVSPSEIENALLEHPEQLITDVAVAGVTGERLSDEKVPRAWIVLSDAGRRRGETSVFEALDEWARTRLSKQKWIRGGYQVIAEIPKLPTGKVLRRKLQEEFLRLNHEHGATRAKL